MESAGALTRDRDLLLRMLVHFRVKQASPRASAGRGDVLVFVSRFMFSSSIERGMHTRDSRNYHLLAASNNSIPAVSLLRESHCADHCFLLGVHTLLSTARNKKKEGQKPPRYARVPFPSMKRYRTFFGPRCPIMSSIKPSSCKVRHCTSARRTSPMPPPQ